MIKIYLFVDLVKHIATKKRSYLLYTSTYLLNKYKQIHLPLKSMI
ncbi:hypothetical protein HMPREF0791_0944 [Staphylococcus epidermidis W23144]|nr:hypothetical protein HMPREF0791_0944 [Staphylococcus epidermidis W23144]